MRIDPFALSSALSFALIAGLTLLILGKQRSEERGTLFLVVVGTIFAYASDSIWLFALGWMITAIPYFLQWQGTSRSALLTLASSTCTLLASAWMISRATNDLERQIAFGLLVLAALLRKGIFPFHGWVIRSYEEGSLPLANLLFNGHLGAFAIIRFGLPMAQEAAVKTYAMVSILAIGTALYTAFLALGEKNPRRILGLISLSQGAFILAGIEESHVEGITGALVHWWVVSFATTLVCGVLAALEARSEEVSQPVKMMGYATHAPRMAVFFLIGAFAIVGLPGTLGFAAEDLLFHGSLEAHPWVGLGLPLATALNAITMLRLFSLLFLGRKRSATPAIPDALPRERWAFGIPVLLLIAGGIAPAGFVALRAPAAHWIAQQLSAR